MTCDHCGTPIDSHKTPTKGRPGRQFCCPGCRAVFELLEDKGLSHYYKLAEKVGATLCPIMPRPGDEVMLPPTVATGDSITLALGGIHCASCVWLLERLPLVCEGVSSARVRLTQGDISISYDQSRTSPQIIANTIQTLGYTVYPLQREMPSSAQADRNAIVQIGIAGACAMNIMVLAVSLYQGLFTGIEERFQALFRWMSLGLCVPVVGYSALPMYRKGIGALRAGSLHIDLPITIGILLSFLLSTFNTISGWGEIYFDSIATIVFLLLSTRHLQHRAFDSARRACASRWSLLPPTITIRADTGEERQLPISSLRSGMKVSIKAGERVPCDGTIEEGVSVLDCATITGESMPVVVQEGSPVLAGSLNVQAPLLVLSATEAGSSRLDRIITSVTSSVTQPPRFITSLDTFSMLFTAAALLLAGGAFVSNLHSGFQVATSAAIAMLAVTCPCAVALALPLLSIRALSAAAERGILVKSPDVFENLCDTARIFIDKTGTLTQGDLSVSRCEMIDSRPEQLLHTILSRLTEIDPSHPVSRAIRKNLSNHPLEDLTCVERKRIPGCGVTATFRAHEHRELFAATLSSLSYFNEHLEQPDSAFAVNDVNISEQATIAILAIDSRAVAVFHLIDSLREEASETVKSLSLRADMHLLSGDREEVTREVARTLGIQADHAHGELLPEEKARIIKEAGENTLYIGDGANNAPALHAATIGVVLRGGIQSILESATVFIDRGGIEQVPLLFRLASRYRSCSRFIVGLGLSYNAIGIGAAFLGYISPLVAAIAMPIFSSVLLAISYSAFSGLGSPRKPSWT